MARFSRAETFDPSEIVSGHTIARTARLCYLLGNDQHASTAPGRWRATIHRNPKPGNHQERRPLKIRDPTLPYLTDILDNDHRSVRPILLVSFKGRQCSSQVTSNIARPLVPHVLDDVQHRVLIER